MQQNKAMYRVIDFYHLYRYQDDWLKTSANSLQVWEKAPLEPYALQKPVSSIKFP